MLFYKPTTKLHKNVKCLKILHIFNDKNEILQGFKI